MLQYLVFLGGTVNILGTIHYIKETLRGRTQPNRVSYLMWSIAPMIAMTAALAHGVRWAALPIFFAGLPPLVVFIASFVNPNAYWKLTLFDYLCGFFSLLALILWGITKEPIVAIIFAIVSDGFAGLATLVKAWNRPESESGITYLGSLFNGLTGFFAVKSWILAEYAFPIYIVISNSLLCFAIYRKKFR